VIEGEYKIFPVSEQQPHPPLFMAGATDRSLTYAARHGFGLMLSTLPSADSPARQIALYRSRLKEAPAPLDQNPAAGKVDIARWVYVADTDAAAKRDSEQGTVRHISHFMGAGTAGYLGNVSEKNRAESLSYDDLAATTLLHGSPATVIAKLRELRHKTGLTSLLLHYPPYYGHDKAMQNPRSRSRLTSRRSAVRWMAPRPTHCEKGGTSMETMTITIESDRGTRMRFEVEHEPHFDLRSEEVDGLHSTVRTVESTLAGKDDGRLCLVLAKLTLGSILEALPLADEAEEEDP